MVFEQHLHALKTTAVPSPTAFTIPSTSPSTHRQVQIPLRNLASSSSASANRGSQDSKSLLQNDNSHHGPSGSRSSVDLDNPPGGVGDLGGQLTDQEDPSSLELQDAFGGRFPVTLSSRHRRSGSIELRDRRQDSTDSSNHGHITKKIVIHIPTPLARAPSGAQRILAFMSGGRNGTSIHGLTGKPLLFVYPILPTIKRPK